MNKLLIVFSMISFSLFALEEAKSVEAPGKVFYKMPSGELVKRDVTLVVPAMGKGHVLLKYDGKEAVAKKFWTKKQHGKITFNVLFEDVPGAPKEWGALYTGAYLRGSNAAVYYGDVYAVPNKGFKKQPHYVGGFAFKAGIQD